MRMGFSGELIFGRSERPLLEAPVFADACLEAGDRVSQWPARPSGWQTLQFGFGVLADPEGVLAGMIGRTRSPACWVSVYDSDVAVITGASPDGARWEACLNLELAAVLWTQTPEDVEDTSVWAVSPAFAGRVPRRGVADQREGVRPGRAAACAPLPAWQVGHHAILPGRRPIQPGGA
jgi:hypothetical protein